MGKTVNSVQVSYGNIKAFKFEYKWPIPCFKKLANNYAAGQRYESEYIYCNLENESKLFHLILYPHGYNKRVDDYLSVFLKKYDESDEMLIQLTFAIFDSNNKEINVKSIKRKMSIESHIGWISYYRRDYLLDDENPILTDGNLILNCTIEIFENKALMNAETEDDINISMSNLSTDMNQLLSEGEFPDFSLAVEGQDFPVHKAILSARSAVFKRLLNSQLQADSREIFITDIKSNIVQKMLQFIYSGSIEHTDVQTAKELYYAADKYELSDLRKMCYKILKYNLDINNAIDILLLGHRHTDTDLESASLGYIAKNLSDFQDKEEWLELMKNFPKLANLVVTKKLKKSSMGK